MFITDIIEPGDIQPHRLNLICAGCGTGKTYWATKVLPHYWDGIKPGEIVVVTSRALAARQVIQDVYSADTLVEHPEVIELLKKDEIHVLTHSTFGQLLAISSHKLTSPLWDAKIVVVDEIHALVADSYNKANKVVAAYIQAMLHFTDARIIGMTATPGILLHYGLECTMLNTKPLVNYKARQLICTDFDSVVSLVNTKLRGRTIIMCPDAAKCYRLAKHIPNSFVLVSAQNEGDTADMRTVRKILVEDQILPETAPDGKPLNVLIGTSTMREGFTIRAESGVRNVVCCCNDEISIIQFAGRVRDNLDCLVVAQTRSPFDNRGEPKYVKQSREEFGAFMAGAVDSEWFERIAHIVDVSKGEIEYYKNHGALSAQSTFLSYINKNWLDKEIRARGEEIAEITSRAFELGVVDCERKRDIVFSRVAAYLVENGYRVQDSRRRVGSKLVRFKKITKR